jgi:hypothetical protein
MRIEGIEVNITPGTFAEAMALKKAVADALKEDGVHLDLSGFKIDFDNLENSQYGDFGGFIELILSVATDERVRGALFDLCGRVTVGAGENKVKPNEEYFDIPENRRLYYPLMIAVARENLAPFFKFQNGLSSILGGLMSKLPKRE